MFIAFTNCFMVPLEVAVELSAFKNPVYKSMNVIIDTIFFLDILVTFNTSLNENSEEIRDRNLIAIAYLKGSFTIDFLSAFPVDAAASLLFPDLGGK